MIVSVMEKFRIFNPKTKPLKYFFCKELTRDLTHALKRLIENHLEVVKVNECTSNKAIAGEKARNQTDLA